MSRKLLACAAALLLVACTSSVKDYQDGMKRAAAAQRKGDLGKAEDLYTATFEFADERGNASESIFSADAAAQMALAQHAPARALALYERLFARYSTELSNPVGRTRLRNNLGVLRARAGRVDEGIAAIEDALEKFDGHGISPAFPFEPRAMLSRNLLAIHASHPWDDGCESAYQSTLAWAKDDLARDPTGQFTWGAYSLFKALGDAASRSPRPDEAAELYELARQAKARDYWRDRGEDRNWCDTRSIFGLTTKSCYEIFE